MGLKTQWRRQSTASPNGTPPAADKLSARSPVSSLSQMPRGAGFLNSRPRRTAFDAKRVRKELRNQVGEGLGETESGEVFTITVCGRPVARLVPANRQSWVPGTNPSALWEMAPDASLAEALEGFDYELRDPGMSSLLLDTSVLIHRTRV
jgi:prevent-host-death family protein